MLHSQQQKTPHSNICVRVCISQSNTHTLRSTKTPRRLQKIATQKQLLFSDRHPTPQTHDISHLPETCPFSHVAATLSQKRRHRSPLMISTNCARCLTNPNPSVKWHPPSNDHVSASQHLDYYFFNPLCVVQVICSQRQGMVVAGANSQLQPALR